MRVIKSPPHLRPILGPLAAITLALPVIVMFLQSGLAVAADAEIHIHRMMSVVANFQAGYLWPRWTPYLHQGFGYPIHNFYAPGLHILGAVIYLITHLDPVLIFKILLFAATMAYPLGAYLFARRFTGTTGGLIAAAAYLYTPFRFHELLAQLNLSQYAAMALLPWLLWAITRTADMPTLRRAALVALLFAAIILLHHPTAFLFSVYVVLYTIIISVGQNFLRRLIVVGSGLAIGAALSAIFWLPALAELQYTQISSIQTGIFSTSANFITLDTLIAGVGPIDRGMLGFPVLLKTGQPHLIAALMGLIFLVPRFNVDRRLKLLIVLNVAVIAVCLLMIDPASGALWARLPLANLIVYPWRLLGIIAVATLPGAAAIPVLFPIRWRTAIAGALIGIFFVATLPLLYAPISFVPVNAASAQDEILYEQHTGNVGLTSGDEYLPRWASERPLAPPRIDYSRLDWHVAIDQDSLPQAVNVSPLSCTAGSSCYTISTAEPFMLIFGQMYFPGWNVQVNGQDTQLSPHGLRGLMAIQIPSGDSTIRAWYGGTPIQHAAAAISVVSLIVVFAALAFGSARRTPLVDSVSDEIPDVNLLATRVIAVMVIFVVVNQAVLIPHTTLFRPNSDPNSPPAQYPAHVIFGDSLALVGYDLPVSSAAPGQSVPIRLYWRLLKPVHVAYRGVISLTAPDGSVTWGSITSLNLGGGISSAGWPTDRYVVDSYSLPINTDAPPYVGQIRVAIFTFDGNIHYLPLADDATTTILADLRITGSPPADNPAFKPMNVQFGDLITLRGYLQQPGENGQQCLTFRWQANRDGISDQVVMLHLRDSSGAVVGNADSPPLRTLYQTSRWLKDQILDDKHCFTVPPNTVDVAIGLYERNSGQRLTDDSLIIPLS
jgi:hypothetical protein